MGIKTLKIRQDKDKWDKSIRHTEGDFEPAHCLPNAMGFIHYDDQIDDEEAFNRLIGIMINKHLDEISRLEFSLLKLNELKNRTLGQEKCQLKQ